MTKYLWLVVTFCTFLLSVTACRGNDLTEKIQAPNPGGGTRPQPKPGPNLSLIAPLELTFIVQLKLAARLAITRTAPNDAKCIEVLENKIRFACGTDPSGTGVVGAISTSGNLTDGLVLAAGPGDLQATYLVGGKTRTLQHELRIKFTQTGSGAYDFQESHVIHFTRPGRKGEARWKIEQSAQGQIAYRPDANDLMNITSYSGTLALSPEPATDQFIDLGADETASSGIAAPALQWSLEALDTVAANSCGIPEGYFRFTSPSEEPVKKPSLLYSTPNKGVGIVGRPPQFQWLRCQNSSRLAYMLWRPMILTLSK